MEEIIFPNQIRMFRRVRGKPMKSLANALGLSLSAISKIEKGYRRIDEEQLEKISKFLDCPKDAIFVTENSSQPEVIKAWKREQERRKKINSGSGFKTMGAGLRYLRGEKGLTLQDVTKAAKLTLSVYHRIEMGQREVDEKTFRDIAHALGYSEADLQLKIYELDISGALDELKQTEDKTGVFVSKGGYNDLPVSRFMMRNADSKEVTVPIYGLPSSDGAIIIDKEHPIGSILCPSTLSDKEGLYGIRLVSQSIGSIIPQHSILVASPKEKPGVGDIAVMSLGNDKIRLVSIVQDKNAGLSAKTMTPGETIPVDPAQLAKMHRIVSITMP
ncbi:MAG: helix-turn-helix domain-containing protein [Lactobacillales bacterium]|jgi:transcriptional regulator with XRE-family HTH domain|nr:helix-turn-helix domain-containing protein [Lactobacillales bacterium]